MEVVTATTNLDPSFRWSIKYGMGKPVPLQKNPSGVAITPNGAYAYVATHFSQD